MPERKCLMCGAPFPPGTAASRKYCFDCLDIRHEQFKIRHRDREREKAREKAAEKRQNANNRQPKALKNKDMVYCAKCYYRGRFSEGYLCNYFCMTGKLRGCKAGFGCEKRETAGFSATGQENRTCERCGARYIGTKVAHFCPECRKAASRENVRKATEARAKMKSEAGE